MADTKKLKFKIARGYGAIFFAAGAEADVPEPWASHFLRNGSAELAEAPKEKAETKKAEPKKAKGKK